MHQGLGYDARRYRILAGALIAIGVVLRAWQFAARRSLWYDESMIALNIATRSFGEFFLPLDLGQNAPPLYLIFAKGATSAFGTNEWAMRLPTLVSGLLLLPLFERLARRLVPPAATLVALAFVALSPGLIYFSNEVKPYALDAFVATLLVWLWLRAREMPDRDAGSRGAWILATAAGVLAVWASHPAVFVLAALGLSAAVADLRAGARARFLRTVLSGALWLASFEAAFTTVIAPTADAAHDRGAFVSAFLLSNPDPLQRLPSILGVPMLRTFFDRDLFDLFPGAVQDLVGGLALVIAAAGTLWLVRKQEPERAALVLGPIGMLWVAYLLERYPLVFRLVQFASPLVALLLGIGLVRLLRTFPSRVTVAAASTLLLPAGYHDALQVWNPWRRREQPRPVFIELAQRLARTPETVWIPPGAGPSWIFYTTDWRNPDTVRVREFLKHAAPPDGLAHPNHERRTRAPRRGEADHLVLRTAGRVELLSTFSGQRQLYGQLPGRADPGWAEFEVERIRALAACVWIPHGTSTWDIPLMFQRALADSGFQVRERLYRPGATAALACRTGAGDVPHASELPSGPSSPAKPVLRRSPTP